MNDDFSFDGANAANMPLDLSFSSQPLPEGEAATGFHLPEITPAQEQAKADSPKLVDEWKQDVQMLDEGGLNGLEESAGLETGNFMDTKSANEGVYGTFRPSLTDMDSVRHQWNAMIREKESLKRDQERKRQNMIITLLRADKNDREAINRMAEHWGRDSVWRLESSNDEERSYMLGMRLAEVLGDGDSDAGFQIYKNTHDLWGKGIISPEQIWQDFRERGKDIVEREDRQRVERERRISDLNGVVSRYVSGEMDSLSADERMALFHAGVSVASMEKARRGVRLIESFEQDSRLYNDDIADDLFGVIGNDDDSLMMLCNLLRNRSRSTANDRLGMGGAEKRADEAYREVMENSNPLAAAVAGQAILNAKMVSGVTMTGKVAGVKTKRSLERALQNMSSHEDARMKAAAFQIAVAKARQMGLSDEEAFEMAGVQEQERRELQQKRNRFFSALTTALEGGEDDYFSSDEASSLSKVGYHLGSMTGDTAPWFLPYAGPLIGLNTSIQRRREEGFMLGLDVDEIEKRAFWFGAADTAEEMIGFHALFKATPLYKGVRKLLRTEKGAGVRALVSGSPAAQYALQGVAGTVEEGILEPTAGYLMRSAINPMLDDERGKQTWEQYTSELSQITSGEQGLALLAFSFGLSGLNYSQLSRAAREFRLSLKNYEALGGTAQGYLEAREEKTAEGFLNKALSHLHDSWMEDPQASMERASAAAGERLSGERIESLRELDAWRAAEDAGMVPRVEPAEQEGMFRVYAPARGTEAPREDASVSGEGQEEGAPSYTLMDGEQMTAYLQAFVDADMEHAIVGAQHLLAGDVTVGQALAQGRFDAAEVITRTVRDEQTGAERVVIAPETLGQMKARADMAMAAIRALEAEGVSYEEAAARMDASLSEHISLGTLVQTWEEAQERIRTEQARNPEFKAPAMDAPFSNAYVTKVRRGDTFRRVLRYARGSATVEDLMEETMEQAVISWQAEQGLSWDEFCAMLQEAQRVMNELFPEARGEEMQFIHLDAGKPVTAHDAIEAFSKIGRSRWLADAVRSTSLPSWLRKLLNHLVRFLGYFKARVELGEMVRQAEEQGVFSLPVRQALAVMLDAGNALYRDQQGDLMELSMERARAQAGLDAMFGAGVATEARTLEDELAESKAQDEERRQEAEDEARAPENSPEAQEARREREQARVEALGEPDGSGVFNGAFIEVQEGVRQGFIEKSRLTLCPDVPQFKQGADEQTGVVNPIVGAWQRNAAPISVWRRKDGALQVISGRHRFNACTDEDINCTVYDEAAGFDLDWAQTHDVENNIRDGQASLFEIARYVSRKRLTKEEAVERGIFRKGQSRRGVELGLYGCSDLLDALGNELVSPDDAWRVAMAFRNQNEVQRAGLRALMEGKSWQAALAVMQVAANMDRIRGLAEAAGMTFETDLFGNSHAEEYFSRLAQYAAARVSELTREISSISGASRRPETARKYGVDVRDAAALEAVVKDLKAQRARWQNFGLHEDLIKEANDAVMVELGVKTREEVDRENGVLPLEAPEQEAGSADTGMLQLSQDVSRMLDAALTRGATPAEDEAPAANFSLVSISSGDVVSSAAGMRARLKPLQGKVFVNKNTGIQAVIEARVSGKTVGKAGASQMSVANLKALGFSAEEARRVHYTAATRIHELFENAEDGFFEEAYKQDASKAGAYHFFNTVDIEGIGAFDVNVTAIKYVKEQEGNVLYTLELTIENPATRGAASREGRLPTPFKDGVSTRNLSSYRSFVEKEKAAVRKKAESDGTFMKAPNGKDTNLTEDQWLSVRTEAFKSWFGDWENDPSNASKVVDANGEPLVVYHGTPHEFTVFNKNAEHVHDAGYYGKGFYFTFQNSEYFKPQIARSEAGYYGNRIISAFLNIKNPFDFSSLLEYQGESIDLIGTQSFAFLYNIAKKFPELEGVVEMPGNGRWIDGSFVTNEKEYSFQEYVNLVESIHDRLTVQKVNDRGEEKLYIQYWDGKSWHEYKDKEDGKTYRYKETVTIYRNVEPDLIENMKKNAVFAVLEKVYGMDGSYSPEKIMTWNPEITEAIKAHGHDGIVQSPSGDEVVAFEPTQIKSATDNRGTFDAANPDITFSIIGEKAESFQEYHNNGLSYTDPADGKRKAIIDSRGVRLRKEHVSVSEGGHVNVSLAAALDFPELFRAYPELRRLRVDFYRDSGSGTGGFTDPREHYIAVNVARGGKNAPPGMVLDTILHEVQHVIQGYEGFAQGAGSMSREQALAYLGGSMGQLAGRGDDWAKAALPRLERMKRELEAGTLQPAFVYVFSHGEQEARLAGTFEKNSEGVLMSGLNGFRLLDAPQFSIPLTGDITELGGITFGAGRFGRMAGRVLAPNGDWLYDEMVFRMRAATQRSVSKLRLFETGDRERGLELLAEAQELISTVERYLPDSYGFGLEPYKIWLNVFSLLYGNSGKMAPGDAVASALEAIPMRRWPEIMEGSIGRSFVNWAEKRPELEDVVEEARREIAERQADYELDSAPDADNRAALAARKGVEQEVWRRLFEEHGAEFLEEYGEQKVFRLVGKFMERVVEQIDRFRKDRTLGRIRRVAASVAPRTSPQGKPMRGKMDAESYRRLEERLRLLEMTPAQYDAFFRRSFPEVLDGDSADGQEGRTLWEEVKPQDFVTVETTDAEGGALTLTVTKATFEAYACYEKMNVETAENASRALGEFIATRREAWENAAESKRNEVENMLRPVLAAAGNTDDQAMASSRKKARLKTLPSGPMSLVGYLMNFSQYMQALQSVPAFRGIAKDFERRAARFAVQKQAAEKDALDFVKKAAGRVIRTTDEYEIADWIYEQRRGADTGLTITEQEPDWQGKAREEYRAGVLGLIRRKVRKHGAAKTLAHVAFFMEDMDEGLKEEIRRVWPDARDGVWSEKDAAVFTEKERERYGSQKRYVAEHAAKARKGSKWGKEKRPYQPQSYRLNNISRMEAAYILLLSQQEDYQEMLRLKGFTQDVLEALEAFAGKDVMEFSRALREKLNERGMAVKEMTEKRYGTPFPLIENYFRAFFDVGIEAIDKSIMDAASYGDAATGGKFGLIHARKKHQANLDLTIDVLTAYYAAMNEQDVYLHGSEISRDMRALINYRGEYGAQGARVLEKVIGRDALHKLLVWCDSFDKGMAGNVRGFLEMQKSLNRISSAAAITLLPGRVGTWVKQSTALINAAFSSDEIDPHEWAASMARMAAGRLVLSPRALMERAALDARDATGTAVIREAMSADEAGRSASGAWKKLNVKGMNLLTQTDVGLNAVSSAVLYDAVYRKEMKRHPGLSREEADRRAMMEVELSLSRKAQPMTPQQRSLAAQTRSVWNVGVLFLGGESINTFAETVALWKQGGLKNKAKSVSMFYAHGLLLAAMSAMLNFFTDDERRRKRREWWHIFIDAVQGPLQGIPFLGALAGGAIRGMSSLCGYRYYTATTSLVPFASWDNLERAGKDLVRLFDEEDKDWEDFPLAFMGALRMAAFGAALGGASSPKGAKFKAAAYSAAAFLNLTEFLLRAMKGLPLRLEGK
ncbi:hypothetical protein [uncultured Akkermansia sp.]|jgi:hypothetical protein|uniref:ADP-ribosyltransferase-containing protein n=1 Tax=uncultured Akkermansia sp. TaxID=512294 RepID=UPI0025958225|nr:hypothetical protein [uncultured Akkermansia sp.]